MLCHGRPDLVRRHSVLDVDTIAEIGREATVEAVDDVSRVSDLLRLDLRHLGFQVHILAIEGAAGVRRHVYDDVN